LQKYFIIGVAIASIKELNLQQAGKNKKGDDLSL